jgi:acyl-CoA dehydrogenase
MYEFNEQTKAVVDLVHRLVEDHQMPLERRMLRGETLTLKDYEPGMLAAKAVGLWALRAPPQFDGAQLGLVDRLAVIEENSRCLTPLRFGGHTFQSLFALTGVQKERYLDPILAGRKHWSFAQTEPGGGADPARAVATTARRDDQGWILNGSKIWITAFDEADVVFVVARTDKSAGARGMSMFAVEKENPGLIAREVPMLGGMKTHQLTFDDCLVDDSSLVGAEGHGLEGAQIGLTSARFEVAASALGVAQRAYEMMVSYAKDRVAFGGPLADKQAVQTMVVDSWIDLQQNRLMLYRCAERSDGDREMRIEAGLVKMQCTEMVGRILDRAIQVHGAAGCTYESPLAWWYDRQRMARIYEGPTEVHKYRLLARHLLS